MAVPKKKISLFKRKISLNNYINYKYKTYYYCKNCFVILQYNKSCIFCAMNHKKKIDN